MKKVDKRKSTDFEIKQDDTFNYSSGYNPGGGLNATTSRKAVDKEIKIRNASKKDATIAAHLIHLAIDDIAEKLTGESKPECIRDSLANIFREEKNRLSYQNTIVAEVVGEVAGILISYQGELAVQLDEPLLKRVRKIQGDPNITFDQETFPGDFYIDTLCVSSNFQGYGIGTTLLKEAEEMAKQKGYQRISLNVAHDNPLAKRLYKKLGYIEEQVIQINGHDYDYMVKIVEGR